MFPNCIGAKVFWTRERVLDALKTAIDEIDGPLPCSDRAWYKVKRYRYDLPSLPRMYKYFGSIAQAWVAAGADPRRVTLLNTDWSEEDELYLMERAGIDTIEAIGKHLGRSYGSVRKRLQAMGITARGNQGMFSAAEIAKEYNCSYSRVCDLLAAGTLPGKYDRVRNRWEVDVMNITPDIEELLRKPRRSHKDWPIDRGDYYRRYGIKRTVIDGKLVRVEVIN